MAFPSAPATNDEYVAPNGVTYIFTGYAWRAEGSPAFTASSPLTGAGTPGSPLDVDFSALAAADAQAIATEIAGDATATGTLATALSVFTNAINAEAATRGAADTTLQNNINTEATTRGTADTNEANARIAADNTLQTNINTEASTRGTADTTLQTNITNEANSRTSADGVLQGQIDDIMDGTQTPLGTFVTVVGDTTGTAYTATLTAAAMAALDGPNISGSAWTLVGTQKLMGTSGGGATSHYAACYRRTT